MKIPVLYLVFNRPDLVEITLDALKGIKPEQLFIAADGPREDFPEDLHKCQEVRKIIQRTCDWSCDVKFLYNDKNLGCGRAVSKAISWFFSNVPEGIILEDDCLPESTFYQFCEEMLSKYRADQRIFHVSGSNWQMGKKRGAGDYYFSTFPAVWGWATWRDRWQKYNLEIIDSYTLEKVKQKLEVSGMTESEKRYHVECFKLCKDGLLDTWDYQWRFLIMLNDGISITPNRNLVSNIGHRDDGTHTIDHNHWRANMMLQPIKFPLSHPKKVRANEKADRFIIYKLLNRKKESIWDKFRKGFYRS